jgi:hypothetical protein
LHQPQQIPSLKSKELSSLAKTQILIVDASGKSDIETNSLGRG